MPRPLDPVLHNKKSLQNEKAPLATTRESPRSSMKPSADKNKTEKLKNVISVVAPEDPQLVALLFSVPLPPCQRGHPTPWAAGGSLVSQGLGFLGISSRCQRAE